MSNKERLSSSPSSSSSPKTKRLFFAIWPDENVVQDIEQHAVMHFKICQGRILDKHNWHITLAYFGSSDAITHACLEEQAEKIQSQPFELKLSLCGFWPSPKVAWLAPEEIPETLTQLTADLQLAIQPCGFKPETRDYQPHISLVRKAKYTPAVLEIKPIKMKVTRFYLAESKTSTEGAEYTILKAWDL